MCRSLVPHLQTQIDLLVPAWINNHMPSKLWFEKIYAVLEFNSYTCGGIILIQVSKGPPDDRK